MSFHRALAGSSRVPGRPAARILLQRTYASAKATAGKCHEATHPDECPPETADLMESHSRYLLNTYARPPLMFDRGSGLSLWDTSGREYLDFSAGIAVTGLGHSDEGFNKVLAEQSAKVSHISNLYWNKYAGELAKDLVEATRKHGGLGLSKEGGDGAKVFFANSGAEANEGALKFARKYGKDAAAAVAVSGKDKALDKSGIVCFTNAFHGRTMGAISCTPNPKYQAPFAPLIPNIRVGQYNDMDEKRMLELVDESVCGVIVEPIQGEGGVGTGKVEWLEMLGKRCRKVGAVLIFDEIQCGMFRTGEMWRHSSFPKDAQPDMVTTAKALGNGFPIGAILVRDHVAEVISIGSHGTTFGGQPLAVRMGHYVFSRLSEPSFVKSVNETAAHLDSLLEGLSKSFSSLITDEKRGKGFIRGIAFKDESHPAELVRLARERGLLLLTAGKDAVRLVPALIVTKEQCDKAVAIMESCLSIMQEKSTSKAK
ncbi:putative acetylornithine transaminase [Kockovaella imperatae]|uniref:acetylornithine transaminase n=1 Tax=Kockovaella imperatae TaxID=4999 RepID=A0A1Y1UU23_9TREE|nr:putative acetylornithine transaminase [Kockovaella imperatae]ORX41034.1 putative acetylornithine transaminase [Kockovaella imperatae]